MTAPPIGVYLDSNAIIRFVEGKDDGFSQLIDRSKSGSITLYTSELTLAEVLVDPLRESNGRLVAYYQQLLAIGGELFVISVARHILYLSAENRALLGNKGADSIHVATAVAVGCTTFISSDKRIRLPAPLDRVAIDAVVDWVQQR